MPKFAYSALFKVVVKPAKLLLEDINDIACGLFPVSSWEELYGLDRMLTNGVIDEKQFIELYTGGGASDPTNFVSDPLFNHL